MDDLFSYQSTGILIGLAGSFGRSIGSSSLVGDPLYLLSTDSKSSYCCFHIMFQ